MSAPPARRYERRLNALATLDRILDRAREWTARAADRIHDRIEHEEVIAEAEDILRDNES